MSSYEKIGKLLKQKFLSLGLAAALTSNSGCKMPGNIEDNPPNYPPSFDVPAVYVNGSPKAPEYLRTENIGGVEKEWYRVTIDEGDDFVLQLNCSDPEWNAIYCHFLTWTKMPVGTMWDYINYLVECSGSYTSSAGRTNPYIMEFVVFEESNPDRKDYLGVEWFINDTIP